MNIIAVFRSALIIMIPLLFAAIGGLYPALAGSINIALEGLLLMGAFSALAVFYFTGNAVIAVIAAIFSAMILSLIHAFSAFKLKANLFITGLAVNILSGALCVLLAEKLFNTKGVITSDNVNGILPVYLITGLILIIITMLIIYKTPFGFYLRACEKNSEALISLGRNPDKYRTIALLISALFCGIGGSFLSLNLGAFVSGMSAGKGWIALVVIFLGRHKPYGIFIAAFIFGFIEAFSNYAQGFLSLPSDFILAIPYIFTLIAMIVVSVFMKRS